MGPSEREIYNVSSQFEPALPPPDLSTYVPTERYSDEDLEAANFLMSRFADVRGNGSDQDLAQVLEWFGELGGGELALGWNRPWDWWTGMAREATARRDLGLAAKIFFFTVDYTENVGPKLPNAFCLGVGYGEIGDVEYKTIATIALDVFKVMQAEHPEIDYAPEIAKAEMISSSLS